MMGALAASGLLLQAPFLEYRTAHAIDGRSFLRILQPVTDASGAAFAYTDVSAVCAAWSNIGDGTPVVTFETDWSTVTVGGEDITRLTISADDDTMRGLARGQKNRRCVWSLWFDDGTDSLDVWSAYDSNLIIHGRG